MRASRRIALAAALASLALGSAEVSLWQQATAYRTLALGGAASPLRLHPSPVPAPRQVLSHAASFVVANVLADPSAPFHYSPLKVAEYLAAGVPVIAPDVASLAQRLEPGRNAVLYPAGDTGALRRALDEVRTDAALRTRLRAGALDSAPAWSWDEQVRKVRTVLQHGR